MQGPGTFNNIQANTVVVFGPATNVVGLFEYAAGTIPALGNLPIAWISESTKDPFGNTLPGGSFGAKDIVTYNKLTQTLAWLSQGSLNLVAITDFAPGGLGVQNGHLGISSPSTSNLDVSGAVELNSQLYAFGNGQAPEFKLDNGTVLIFNQSGPAPGGTKSAIWLDNGDGFIHVRDAAGNPTGIASDTWTNVGNFQNGWTSGGDCRTKLDATSNTVRIELELNPGTLTDSTHICTLGNAKYKPNKTKNLWAGTRGGTAITNDAIIQVLTGGDIQCLSLPTGATSVRVNGVYSLD